MKNQYIGVGIAWGGAWIVLRCLQIQEGGLGKNRVLLKAVDTPVHTMSKVGGWGILRNVGDLSNGG